MNVSLVRISTGLKFDLSMLKARHFIECQFLDSHRRIHPAGMCIPVGRESFGR